MEASVDPTVLVIGAGPSGLVAAIELRRRGIPVRVIDKAPGPTGESRALGLQARTLEVFDALGVIDDVLARGRVLNAMNVYDRSGRHLARIDWHLPDRDTPHPFEMVLPQSETTAILLDRVHQLGGRVDYATELVGLRPADAAAEPSPTGGYEVFLRRDGRIERLAAPWLIGADGASSLVRRALDIPFTGDTYAEHFLLADVSITWAKNTDEGHVFLSAGGPVVTFPYPERGRWRIIDTTNQATSGEPGYARDRFQSLLDASGVAARVEDVRWSSLFRFHRRIAARTQIGHAFLIGDAAHIHSPATAQGLNTGVQDAFNLGWKLALVAAGHADERLLTTYQTERAPIALAVLRDSDRMTRLVLIRNTVLQRLRNLAVATLLRRPAVNHRVARAMSNLDLRYDGDSAAESGARTVIRPGQRAPSVGPAAEPAPRLLPVLRATGLSLLAFPGRTPLTSNVLDRLAAVAEQWAQVVDVHVVNQEPSRLRGGLQSLPDPTGRVARRYTGGGSGLVLIRPDGYVSFAQPGLDTAAVVRHLDEFYRPTAPAST